MFRSLVILSSGSAALFAIPILCAAAGFYIAGGNGFLAGFFIGIIPAGTAYGLALDRSLQG